MRKKIWIAAAGAMTCAAALTSSPAAAHASAGLHIGAPALRYGAAPPVYEYRPGPRRGHVWVPGRWQWQGNGHVWIPGYFVPARPRHFYGDPRWIDHGDRWSRHSGGWSRRDRDGDGVPNRYDRAPDNPYYR